ncbi:CheR family methyltransferase [Persephonella sp.]
MANVTFEQLKKVRDILKLRIGMFIDDTKLITIYRRKIIDLMERNGFKDFDRFYSQLVYGDKNLLQQLYNTMTINETYFFREKDQFEYLVNKLLPEIEKKGSKEVSILSAPSSTGEEVYSIAIYLMEKGVKTDFILLGIDIDSEAVEKAEKGFYTEKSMRGLPSYIKENYFLKVEGGYKVVESLKRSVSFKVVNVLDRYEMRKLGRFDIIFSRNMLIYFEDRMRNEVLATFYSILKPEGYLFLGHAERIPPSLSLFEEIKEGRTIVYKKV